MVDREGSAHAHKDMSSGPKHPHKKLGVAIYSFVTPALCVGGWGQEGDGDWLAASSAPGSGETPSQGNKVELDGGYLMSSAASTCMYTHM